MRFIYLLFIGLFFLNACASSPYRKVLEIEIIENPYVSFYAPNRDWYVHKKFKQMKINKKSYPSIHTQSNKASYNITLASYPYEWMPIEVFFDKKGDYEARNIRGKYNPKNIGRRLEQGIYYNETWITYIQGMKCNGTVFSRDGSKLQQYINSKNYAIGCGYYHKTEGKRILRIGYRYSYEGKAKNGNNQTANSNYISKKQAENYLKHSVSQLIKSIRIKDIDWQKMQREGLLHPNTSLDMSVF